MVKGSSGHCWALKLLCSRGPISWLTLMVGGNQKIQRKATCALKRICNKMAQDQTKDNETEAGEHCNKFLQL